VAKGRAASRLKTFLALLGLIAVPVTYAIVTGWNPLPDALHRLAEVRRFSAPDTAWAVRLDDVPTSAAQGSGVVLIFEQGTVEARNPVTGEQTWTRTADWAAVAGSAQTGGTVVLLGIRGSGYAVVDSGDGHERWRDAQAIGAWTFSDQVVSISCPEPFSCALAGHTPGDGAMRWQAPVEGNGHGFSGANKPLAGLRPFDPGYTNSLAGLPQPAPPLLGLRVDHQVQVYSTHGGQRLRSYRTTSSHWVTVAGSRVLVTSYSLQGSRCRYSVSAQDPVSGQEVWSKSGWDPDTADGLGCDQRRAPAGRWRAARRDRAGRADRAAAGDGRHRGIPGAGRAGDSGDRR
jgi:outer membrane protein assembly factor BamB